MSSKTIGDFGELLTALLLQNEFENKGLVVIHVGAGNLPYDLLIPYPSPGTPFTQPTVISVKTRSKWDNTIPPSRNVLEGKIAEFRAKGYDFWIGFVKYRQEDRRISFGVFLLPASLLIEEDDFHRMGNELQIVTARLIEKATIKFTTIEF